MRFFEIQILFYTLWSILVLAFFYIWAEKRYDRISRRFARKEVLGKIVPSHVFKVRKFGVFLNIAAVCLIGIALARPQWGVYWKAKRTRGADVIFALDVSKSMLARDAKPDRVSTPAVAADRLTFAKKEIKDFVRRLQGGRAGLIVFSGEAFLSCPLTSDYDGFFLILDNSNIESVARGGTSIAGAMEEAMRNFKWAAGRQKILIIISDGENTAGNIDKAVDKAKEDNIVIHCVGIGSREGEIIQYADEKGEKVIVKDENGNVVRSKLDEDTLKKIARETGGMYAYSDKAESALGRIYKEKLEKLEKQEIEETLEKSYKERFQFPVAIALILLLADMVLILVTNDEV